MSLHAETAAPYVYRAFGLTLQSAIELPELRRANRGAVPDVFVRLGDPDAFTHPTSLISAGVRAGPNLFVMRVDQTTVIAVVDGREMVVQLRPGASPESLRAYLLGSAIGALLHQRRLLPLHASAVVCDGVAFAFVGHSGAGKSTLALELHAQGLEILCDDICAVTSDSTGMPSVWPGLIRLKLWRQSLEGAGLVVDGLSHVHENLDKYQWPVLNAAPDRAYRLGAIYHLCTAKEDPNVDDLRGINSIKILMDNTFRGQLVEPMQRTAEHLSQCLDLAKATPIFQWQRPWGPDGLAKSTINLIHNMKAQIVRLATARV